VTTVDEAKERLHAHGILVVEEKDIQHGVQLRCDGGQTLNIYGTGRISLQGKGIDGLREEFNATSVTGSDVPTTTATVPTDVFIVYGHNEVAKHDVERMLRKWGFNPIILIKS